MDEILIDRTGQPAAIAASDGNPWLRHQGGQPGNEVQGLEDDMRGAMPKTLATLTGQAFAVRCLQLAACVAVGREREALILDALINETVRLAWMPCNYGGERPWFIRPTIGEDILPCMCAR